MDTRSRVQHSHVELRIGLYLCKFIDDNSSSLPCNDHGVFEETLGED